MTRKEELEARARDYVSLFVTSGAESAATKRLAWMLEQAEREVWGKVMDQIRDGQEDKIGLWHWAKRQELGS